MDYMTWLESLQVGDTVAVKSPGRYGESSTYRLLAVERVTPTTIIVNGTKYRKSTGLEITSSKNHTWGKAQELERVTDELRAKLALNKRYAIAHNKVVAVFRDTHEYKKLTVDQLERIVAIIEEAKEPAK